MTWIMVDVESDGPIPGAYSMVSFGAVVVEPGLERRFRGELRPISDRWDPKALQVSGLTREECLEFPWPMQTMHAFDAWVRECKRPMFVSDNNGFDWQFINYYFHVYCPNGNPFGHSSTNLGSLYKGFVSNMSKNFKHLRKTKHTHDPLDDALGNAEAMLEILKFMPEM